ncbi:MAG: hypothetical protein AB8B89_07100 [Gammaproteobacteria bacterium]
MKNKSTAADFFIDGEEEIIAYQRLVKDLNQEHKDVWVDAIDPLNLNDKPAGGSIPWMIEDNNDALYEYMEDVSDFIDPDDISDLDW